MVSRPISAIIATPESGSPLCGISVALPGSLTTSLVPVVVPDESTVEAPPCATPESQEETPGGVPRRHPIPACVRRKHPIASYPRVSSANEIPVTVHPVIPRAWHRWALEGVAGNRRGRRSIDTRVAAVVGWVPGVLPVIVLAIAILSVVVRGALIGWVPLRILLWVLLPKHGRTESSCNHQHCHPVTFHGLVLLFRRAVFGRLVRIGRCTCLAELNLLKTIGECYRVDGPDAPGGGFQPIVGLKSI